MRQTGWAPAGGSSLLECGIGCTHPSVVDSCDTDGTHGYGEQGRFVVVRLRPQSIDIDATRFRDFFGHFSIRFLCAVG